MSFFTTDKTADAVKESTGGKYISENGIYDVTIKKAYVTRNASNARSINFIVDYEGTEQTIYGLTLDNNDGSKNFNAEKFNKLLVILGIDSIAEPTNEVLTLGKDSTPTEVEVLTELDDQPIKVGIKYEYSLYNGEIKERRNISNFYNSLDGATASEMLSGKSPTQYDKDLNYIKDIKYKDGLTADDVKAWKEAKRNGVPFQADTKAEPSTTTKPKNIFA